MTNHEAAAAAGPANEGTGPMHVSVREFRLFTDRVLMLTGLDLGVIPSVREFLLAAECVGAGALRFVQDELLDDVRVPMPSPLAPVRRAGLYEVDCAGQFAPVVGPGLLDLLSLLVERHGSATVLVRRVRYAALLAALSPLANRRGIACVTLATSNLAADAAVGLGSPEQPVLVGRLAARLQQHDRMGAGGGTNPEESCLVMATAVERAAGQEHTPESRLGLELNAALADGLLVDSGLWWRIYHRSERALTRTSPISRTHTGAEDPLESQTVGARGSG